MPKDQQFQAVQAAILLLPKENREALKILLFFLRDVVAFVEENQMTPTNIAVCLAPSLFHLNTLRRDSSSSSTRYYHVGAGTVVVRSVCCWNSVFCSWPRISVCFSGGNSTCVLGFVSNTVAQVRQELTTAVQRASSSLPSAENSGGAPLPCSRPSARELAHLPHGCPILCGHLQVQLPRSPAGGLLVA